MDKAAVSPLTSSFDQSQWDSGKEEGEAWLVGIGTMWALGVTSEQYHQGGVSHSGRGLLSVCLDVLHACMYVCMNVLMCTIDMQCPRRPVEGIRSIVIELKVVVSHYVGNWN